MNNLSALACFSKLTLARHKKLLAYFGSNDKSARATFGELRRAGWEPEVATEFIEWRGAFAASRTPDILARENIAIVWLSDPNYPALLKEIADPPVVLFVRGVLPLRHIPLLAVVGTRQCSSYGKQVTREFSEKLATSGFGIVSGLALGIDGVAHEAALAVGGRTVAVLGTGVNAAAVYPATHRDLAERIIKSEGAIISEYPPGFKSTGYSFPMRNRIIAGLSYGVLVTEAPYQSGALITARAALDYNREVFVVPHVITAERGQGGNFLIQQGAKLVSKTEDVLEEFPLFATRATKLAPAAVAATPLEEKILSSLVEPLHIDALIAAVGTDSASVSSALTMMEVQGKIRNLGGLKYSRR